MTGLTVRKAVAPAYLFLCLLLGGSAQGMWGNALLQILAVVIIGWTLLDDSGETLPRAARPLIAIVGAGLLLVALQLVPLPAAIWTTLPGREIVANGRELLGLAPGSSSVSLAPYATVTTVFYLLPPIAVFLSVLKWAKGAEPWLALSLVAATFLGVLLGLPQVLGGMLRSNPWHLYEQSNFGFATGFFANKNHMASLLLVAVPFLLALASLAAASSKDPRKRYSVMALTAGGLGVLLAAILLNRSAAAFALIFLVLPAGLVMSGWLRPQWKPLLLGAGIVLFLGILAAIFSPIGQRFAPAGSAGSLANRQEILSTSVEAIKEFGPVGTGLGTFEKVYPLFEDPDSVGLTYVNHAHNDYAELIVELGAVGAVLLLLFLIWWGASVARMLAAPNASLFAKAGAIGSVAILIHSAVDYPLRTAAMSSVFALCLTMILASRTSARSSKDLREARHLVIE